MSKNTYRKKPVVVEAFQLTKETRWDNSDWPEWMHMAWNTNPGEMGALYPFPGSETPDDLAVVTLEGLHIGSVGYWLIQGVEGELYFCKDSVFQATYTPTLILHPQEEAGAHDTSTL
jgi:hypothetical protein